ncbi:MAG: hypothetical protein M3N68_08590 [Actinomycetota bacterium]|nr:hypothetical protein [Actinomycetota bacterium]
MDVIEGHHDRAPSGQSLEQGSEGAEGHGTNRLPWDRRQQRRRISLERKAQQITEHHCHLCRIRSEELVDLPLQ